MRDYKSGAVAGVDMALNIISLASVVVIVATAIAVVLS